jgi:NAD(P)-dependent dehydrogenase (short-subunit alcohol dehydrogenase family)
MFYSNFAGIIGPGEHTYDIKLDDFQKTLLVNTTGVFLSTKIQLQQMMKQDSIDVESGRVQQRGSIVNCASVNSIQAVAGAAAYTASKHAVLGLTKAAALEARGHGVRVNCVSPGFLKTPMITNVLKLSDDVENVRDESGNLGQAYWETFEKRQGREASFEEIGDVVVLLSTPRMSLVNGHNLVIDG